MSKELDTRSRENLERVLLQAAVIKELQNVANDDKARVHHLLEDGETIKVANARGGDLGSIYRTRGKQQAVITDMAVVLAQAVDSGAELEDRLPNEGSPQYWEAVEVLQEHAPHLVRVVILEHEQERMAEEVLKEYHASGDVPEGWRISEGKAGYTAVRTSKLGKEVAARMFDKARGVMYLEAGHE